MTDDDKTPADAATKLRADLRALLRQRDQYALAMDAATDPKVSIRLQRTLERIEEEIEGLEEAVASLPEEPPEKPVEAEEALPDWDEEPSTSIYDPEKIQLHLEKLSAGAVSEPEPEPEAVPPSASRASEFDEEATIALPSGGLEQLRAEAEAAEAREAAATASQSAPGPSDVPSAPHAEAPPEPAPQPEPEPEPTPEPATHPAVAPVSQDEPAEEESNPLGPVWMDGLSPATEELPRDMADKLLPQAPGEALDGVADDPFAMPGQGSSAVSGASTAATAGGFPASPFDNLSNPVSVLDDDTSSDWGFGAKAALFLGVAGFLAGVFYVLSMN